MDNSQEFIDWLSSNGAEISKKISLHDYSNEGARIGLIALEDIKVST